MSILNLSADELLTTTRAVRKRLDFDRPVHSEVISDCIRVAQQAPSASESNRTISLGIGQITPVTPLTSRLLRPTVSVTDRSSPCLIAH